MTLPADWIAPAWPAPPGVRAFVTTRNGGVSRGRYASFNLGLRSGDDPQAVAENRRRLRALLPAEPRWLAQVHGATVVDADALAAPVEADAAVAAAPGTVCAVMIADCLPVLFASEDGRLVAAAHAGWRGLAAGVLENTVHALCERGARRAALLAYIGPGIGPAAFEVGGDVHDAFTADDPQAAAAFAPHRPGKWLADLPRLARRALARAGVERVYGGTLCTHADAARFYSYRRDGQTGRMAALIWRAA
jgi:YfiH family protein